MSLRSGVSRHVRWGRLRTWQESQTACILDPHSLGYASMISEFNGASDRGASRELDVRSLPGIGATNGTTERT
jgi:hypothetical protein